MSSSKSEVSEQDILQELYKVDLLVLDDLGMEKLSKYAGANIYKLDNTLEYWEQTGGV